MVLVAALAALFLLFLSFTLLQKHQFSHNILLIFYSIKCLGFSLLTDLWHFSHECYMWYVVTFPLIIPEDWNLAFPILYIIFVVGILIVLFLWVPEFCTSCPSLFISLRILSASVLKALLTVQVRSYLRAAIPCHFYVSGFELMDMACPLPRTRTHIHAQFSLSKCLNQYIPSFLPEPLTSLLPLGCGFDWIYAVQAAWSWWSWQLRFLSQWISFASQQPPPHCYPQPSTPSL